LTLHSPAPNLPTSETVTDRTMRAALRQQMREAGVSLANIECFNLTQDVKPEDFRAGLECGQYLGARSATAILWENSNRTDALAKFCTLCDMAAEYRIAVNLEFFTSCASMNSLGDALAFVTDAGRPNAGIVIDLLHLMRTGAGIAGLRALDPARVGWVQLCDAPAEVTDPATLLAEASSERLYPGEGALPVRAFIEAIPPDAVVGLEMPKLSLNDKRSPIELATAMREATETVYAS
jgi:sugar phosphate isomerase/epimerase